MFGILVFVGLARSVPSHGAVVMATMPLTSLFIRWVFDKQPPRWWAWAGGWTALVGVGFVSGAWSGGSSLHANTLAGDAIAWVGTLGWILYTRGQQKLPQLSVVEYTAYTAITALPGVCAVALAATLLGWAHLPSASGVTSVAPALAYIIAIGTVLAALLFNFGVRRLGATNGIVAINFVPISALIISAAMGHAPTASELFGTALVVVALLWLAFQMRNAAAVKPAGMPVRTQDAMRPPNAAPTT
jgi:drug/metabolite transporter (DMT)-like permease